MTRRLDFSLQRAAFLDRLLFRFPLRRQRSRRLFQIRNLFFDLAQPFDRAGVGLFFDRLPFDLQLPNLPEKLVELGRHRVDLHPKARGRLVDEVNRLVGEKTVGNVAMRERGGGDQRGVLNPHPVVDFVFFLEAAQNRDRLIDRRLLHHHRLKPSLERGVFFDIFPVFVERGRPDGSQFATGKRRLEHVRRIHRPLRRTGPDQRMKLVDKEDHLPTRVAHLLDHRLEPIFKLAAKLRSRDQRPHVERADPLVFQALRYVTRHNPLRQPFGDGGLADARLSDQHRVVFRPTGKNLDDPANLLVAANHRIEPGPLRQIGQVARIAGKGLKLIFRMGVGHVVRAANVDQRRQHFLAGEALAGEEGAERPIEER